MVLSAALLIREHGAHATSVADVLAHSGAPRGSAYHYFPGGRAQLLREATGLAADFVATEIENADTALDAIDKLVGFYRQQLVDTDYRAGCPIVAVTVESDNRDNDVHQHAAQAFDRWTNALAQKILGDSADELALLSISAIEGAIALSRAQRDTRPLDAVHAQLRQVLATSQRPEPTTRKQ